MAKTKDYKPRRVRSEDDRAKFSSEYIQLDEGEKFVGYALFHADPKTDEPGYYEYMEHYDPSLGRKGSSVPCAESDCPYCEDGEKPRTRAKTLWLVMQVGDKKLKKPELRIFNLSSISINAFTEMRKEGDSIFGKLFRVSRVDDRNYTYTPKEGKLTQKDIKGHLANAPDFEKMLTAAGKRVMEKLMMQRVMDDDEDEDDDDDEETTAKKGGKKKSDAKSKKKKAKEDEPDEDEEDEDEDEDAEESDDEMPDEADDESVTVLKVNKTGKKANTLDVEHESYGEFTLWGTSDIDVSEFSKGDELTVAWEKDDEDDYVLTADPEAAEGEDEDEEDEDEDEDADGTELPDAIEDEVFVITEVDADNETMDVENDELGLTFTLFFLNTVDVDFDEYKAGLKIKVSAEKDTQGDMVSSAAPEKVKAKADKKTDAKKKASGKKDAKTTTKKGGKKK